MKRPIFRDIFLILGLVLVLLAVPAIADTPAKDGKRVLRLSTQDLIKALREHEQETRKKEITGRELMQRFPSQVKDDVPSDSSDIPHIFKDLSVNSASKESNKTHLVGWGDNSSGELGAGFSSDNLIIPVISTSVEELLKPDFKILQIASNASSFCLLRSDKTVWCWGGENRSQQGIVQIGYLPPVKNLVSQNGTMMCATTEGNQAWCWDESHQSAQRFQPKWASDPELKKLALSFSVVSLSGGSGWSKTESGESGCGMTGVGEVWCWGASGDFPAQIKTPQPAIQISSNNWRGCAVLSDSTPWCWRNSSDSGRTAFDRGDKVKQVLAGMSKYCGLKADGSVWCSDGENSDKRIDIAPEKPLSNVLKIALSGEFVCALTNDGSVWCWDGRGFGDPSFGGLKDYALRVRGPDPTQFLDHAQDIAVTRDSALALVVGKDYNLVEETDASRLFYALVFATEFDAAREYYKKMRSPLQKDAPLAQEALLRAVEFGQAGLVKVIAQTGIDVELPGQFQTALWMAIRINSRVSFDVARILLAYGANATTVGPEGHTPLKHMTRRQNPEEGVPELFERYIKENNKLSETDQVFVQGIDVDYIGDSYGNRRLHARRGIKINWPKRKMTEAISQDIHPFPASNSDVAESHETNVASQPSLAERPKESKESLAYVVPCLGDIPKPNFKDHEIVFRGKIRSLDAADTATFDVIKAYKGDIGTTIKITSTQEKNHAVFHENEEALVFARRKKDSDIACTPVFELAKTGLGLGADVATTLVDLELFASKINATGVFDNEYRSDVSYYVLHPDAINERTWLDAAKILEEANDFERAEKLYAALLAKGTAQGVGNNKMFPDEKVERCEGVYAASDSTPQFLQSSGGNREYLRGYGRALLQAERYEEALRPLCLAGDEHSVSAKDAVTSYRFQALLMTGRARALDSTEPDFSGMTLANVNFSNASLERSNFSNAEFRHSIFNGTKLGGANFQGAKITDGVFDNTDFTGANLRGAVLTGDLSKAVLTDALYDAKTVWPKSFDPQKSGAKSADSDYDPTRFIKLPEDFDVVVLGVYEGGYPPGVYHDYKHNPHGRIDVSLHKNDKPFILVVAGNEPVDWYLQQDKGVKLIGIIAGGGDEQRLFGVSGSVQVINYTKERKRDHVFYAPFARTKTEEKLKAVVKELTGKDEFKVQESHKATTFEVR